MAVNVKNTLRDIRMGRMMAYGADAKAEEIITDKLQILAVMDRLIVEQWLDGATFREIADAINWSM